MRFLRPAREFEAGSDRLCLGKQTKLMGVLNVTPDSFSDGGRYFDLLSAEKQALRLQDEGAHILDVGGESSRPGAKRVSVKEEMRRVLPVLKRLSRKIKIPVSIDTTKAEVARAALDCGVTIINDITALSGDRRMAGLIARHKASVVLMHMQKNPRTMQDNPTYRSVIQEVKKFLKRAAEKALEAGISRSKIMIDPGFGFGKTVDQNKQLLRSLHELADLELPLMVGLSRKSFIGEWLGKPVEHRLVGSLAAAAVAIQQGAHVLRVHDVMAHRELAAVVDDAFLTD